MPRTPGTVEDRREQILAAAMHIFAQKGFSRATNKDIAREAGITAGLIYHYFESKEALLWAIIEERSPMRLLRSLPSPVLNLPLEEFLRYLLHEVLTIVESENFVQLIRVLLPEIIHNPQLTPISTSALQQIVAFVERYLQPKLEQGTTQQVDVTLFTQMLLGCMMGFVLRRQIIRDPQVLKYSQDEIVNTIVETLLRGFLPQ